MNNLPPDYQEQENKNKEQLVTLLKVARPDLLAIMQVLDDGSMNWKIVFHVLKALNQLASDTKYGTVTILVEDNIVRFIRGDHADKLNEPIFNKNDNE
jgi:hypothetical protein